MSQPPITRRVFRTSKLTRNRADQDQISPGSPLGIMRTLEIEILIGRHEGGSGLARSVDSLSSRLQTRIGSSSRLAFAAMRKRGKARSGRLDKRQFAVVKVRFFNHNNGSARALKQHERYLARDAASKSPTAWLEPEQHEHRPGLCFNATKDHLDGAPLAEQWSKADARHFRIILSPENAGQLGDLQSYTRQVIARCEITLGRRLEWFGVTHWDGANPHAHVVLRGRCSEGHDLRLPRAFVTEGLRDAARDVATSWLGPRTLDTEQNTLQREAMVHAPSKLDMMIEAHRAKNGELRVSHLEAPNGSPELADALKTRARELKHLGMAQEVRRGILHFEPQWQAMLAKLSHDLRTQKSLTLNRMRDVERALDLPSHRAGKFPLGLSL